MILYIDGMSVVMRPAMVATSFDGGPVTPIEAAQIAMQMVNRWLVQLKPTRVVWAFDHPDANWREYLYPEYKAHRTTDTTPYGAAMLQLVPATHEVYQLAGYEADDVIASLVKSHSEECAVITTDSDYFQLVEPRVTILRPMGGGKLDPWDVARVCEHHDIAAPELYVDWKALVGDKADGLPGVPGVGPKRAAKLLAQYGSLLAIVQAGALLKEHAEAALLYQSLIRLRQSVKHPLPPV